MSSLVHMTHDVIKINIYHSSILKFQFLGETPFDDVVVRLLLKAIEENHYPLRPENCSAEMLVIFLYMLVCTLPEYVHVVILYQIQSNEVMLEAKT